MNLSNANSKILKINENAFFLSTSKTLAEKVDYNTVNPKEIQYFSDPLTVSDDIFNLNEDYGKVAYWGSNNFFPQELASIVANNSITPGLLNFKALMTVAKGLEPYTERIIEGLNGRMQRVKIPIIDLELEEWLEEIEVEKYLRAASLDSEFFRNIFTENIRNRGGNRINKVNRIDATICRRSSDGESVYIYKNWTDVYSNNPLFMVDLYQKGKMQKKYMVHSRNVFPGSGFYGVPTYIGSLNWIQMLNAVSQYKLKSIQNGASIKYHVKYPLDYFTKLYPINSINPSTGKKYTPNFAIEKEQEMLSQMDKYLHGQQNAQKTFFSKFGVVKSDQSKEMPGWQIESIKDETAYDAYIKDVNTATGQIVSSQNIHPSLANVLIEGKLSSGSDLRNAFNIFMQIMTQEPRQLLLEPLNIAKNITFPNKRNIKLGFKDAELTTSDIVKSGVVTEKQS